MLADRTNTPCALVACALLLPFTAWLAWLAYEVIRYARERPDT